MKQIVVSREEDEQTFEVLISFLQAAFAMQCFREIEITVEIIRVELDP